MVRDRISIDTWRILDRMHRQFDAASVDSDHSEMHDMLDQLLMPLAAFSGLGSESMTHGYGWRFMDMGIRMERAMGTIQIMRELLVRPEKYETPILDSILEVANSSITYRSRYQSEAAALPLLDLLVADSTNPRSIAYQVKLIHEHVTVLSKLPQLGVLPEQQQALELEQLIEQQDLDQLTTISTHGEREQLILFLDRVLEKTQALSDAITHRYLAHVQTTQSLSALIGGDKLKKEALS